MRFILLVCFLITVSCGKKTEKVASSPNNTNSNPCKLNGVAVSCESISGADGFGIDLLDTMIDVPVEVSNNEITFLATKSSVDDGRRISCKTSVKQGEIYRYTLMGDKLELQTGQGTQLMDRLNDENNGIIGAWTYKEYVGEGTLNIKTLTLVNNQRAILKTHCEM